MNKDNKQLVYSIAGTTLLSAFSLCSIIIFTDPERASAATFGFLYLSIFLFAFGVFALLGLAARRWLMPKMFVVNLFSSLRQAVLIALLIVISLILLAQKLLFWWVEASLVLLLVSIEFFWSLKS